MPPASSHLAERPVPAPPPTIGSPRRACAAASGCPGEGCGPCGLGELVEVGDQRVGERRVVDVVREPYDSSGRRSPYLRSNRVEKHLVGRGVPERLAGRVDPGHAALGDQEAHRPCMRLSFSAMKRPMRAISSEVVRISVTLGLCRYRIAPELRRHRVHRPEIHHVQGATRSHVGDLF